MRPELLQPNTKCSAHLCEPGMLASSPQSVSDELFLFNQGHENITDGRYSLRRCLNPRKWKERRWCWNKCQLYIIKLTAGKITSRDLGYKYVCFKTKDRKTVTDRDFAAKGQIPEVQLTAEKKMFIDVEDMSESRREGVQWIDVG